MLLYDNLEPVAGEELRTMTVNPTDCRQNQLAQIVLGAHLSEMARVPVWIDELAVRYEVPEKVKFAMNLCLEEALSNIILHGYAENEGFVTVQFSTPRPHYFLYVIYDEARPFDPLSQAALPTIDEQDPAHIGGQGLRLMREFADLLEYESTSTGNQLRLGFSSITA